MSGHLAGQKPLHQIRRIGHAVLAEKPGLVDVDRARTYPKSKRGFLSRLALNEQSRDVALTRRQRTSDGEILWLSIREFGENPQRIPVRILGRVGEAPHVDPEQFAVEAAHHPVVREHPFFRKQRANCAFSALSKCVCVG